MRSSGSPSTSSSPLTVRVFQAASRQLAPLTLAGALLAYVYPPSFLVFSDVFLWLFAATMFALGIVLEPEDLRSTLRKPHRVVLGVMTQYTVMPALAFTVASVGGFEPRIALGFVIVGCAPGAMASNVMVYLAGGALAYSIALTTVATFLSPVVTPSLVRWLGAAFLPIDFWPLFVTICLTVLIPLVLGMTVRRFLRPAHLEQAIVMAPGVAALAIVVICSYAVASNQTRIATVGASVFGYVALLNALGYGAGFALAWLYGFDHAHRLTLAIEIGMQNAGLGVALALAHFEPETALPGALFAAWCVLTAAGANAFLARSRVAQSVRL